MRMDSSTAWWVYRTAGVQGPYPREQLARDFASGVLSGSTLVCEGSSGQWVTAQVAFGASPVPPPPPPGATVPSPPAPPTAPGFASPGPGYAAAPKDLSAPVDIGLSVFLSVITFGIWWLVWVYSRLAWYAQQAGRPMGNRVTYFWLYVGLNIGGFVSVLIFPLLWIPIYAAVAVFGSLLAYELAKDQQAIVDRSGGMVPLPATPTTLVVLFAVGTGVGVTIVLLPVTVVLLVFYYLFYFRNHNAVAQVLTSSRGNSSGL